MVIAIAFRSPYKPKTSYDSNKEKGQAEVVRVKGILQEEWNGIMGQSTTAVPVPGVGLSRFVIMHGIGNNFDR